MTMITPALSTVRIVLSNRYGTSVATEELIYEPHVGVTRQYWRDIVLGVNDGLVSMMLLAAGVVGGGLDTGQVTLTVLAGALAGALSMGAGEYLATKSQDEVIESELRRERAHIHGFRQQEVAQLYGFFSGMGVSGDDLTRAVEIFSRDDAVLLNAMKALEFGVVDTERRSPYRAMTLSAVLFLAGSLPSVVPFALGLAPATGLVWASALTLAGLFAVGGVKAAVTGTGPVRSGAENLIIAGVGGVAAFLLGRWVGGFLS
jgi:VIT1/CCC1 family predicted Fe2+/Mn2+ transporter